MISRVCRGIPTASDHLRCVRTKSQCNGITISRNTRQSRLPPFGASNTCSRERRSEATPTRSTKLTHPSESDRIGWFFGPLIRKPRACLRHTSQRVLTSCGQALLGLTSILWARPRTGGYRWQRSRQNSKSNERSTLMTNKPNILLVHGAWGDASHWRHVIPPLHEKGYCVFAVQNPLTSLSDDIDRTIKMAAAQDAPTLLVGHAYGCAVITSAGLTPNVVGLVYLAGPALDEGESLKSLWARRAPPEGAANIREDKYGFLWIEVGKFHETFCHDLEDRTESLVWALTQKPTASRCFEEKLGPPAWKVKPSWYQISANDRLIPTETEKWMAERINARRTITLPTSHASIATRPDDIVQLIEEASDAVVAKAAGFR